MSEKKYYEILYIESSAERKQIHEAYKYLAKEYQYEENDLFEYISKMKELNEAYLVLSDPVTVRNTTIMILPLIFPRMKNWKMKIQNRKYLLKLMKNLKQNTS